MATVIKLKSGTQNSVPSSLQQGEFAINVDNGNLYYGSGSDNDVKQNISLQTLRISGSQTDNTDVAADTPIIGENMNSGIESGVVLITGSFDGSGEWDVNLFKTPITNHSVDFNASYKFTLSDGTIDRGEAIGNIGWDPDSSDFTTDESTSVQGSSFIPQTADVPYQRVLLINSLTTAFFGLSYSNFQLHGPTSDYAIFKWITGSNLDTSDLSNAEYEVVVNYKAYKF